MRCVDIEEFHRLCESYLQHISLCLHRDSKLETSVTKTFLIPNFSEYPGCNEQRAGSLAWRPDLLGVEPSSGPVSAAVWHSPFFTGNGSAVVFRQYPYRTCGAGRGREMTKLRVLQISDKCYTSELYPQLTLWVISEKLYFLIPYTYVLSHSTTLEDTRQGCGQFSSLIMQFPGMERWSQAFKISPFTH